MSILVSLLSFNSLVFFSFVFGSPLVLNCHLNSRVPPTLGCVKLHDLREIYCSIFVSFQLQQLSFAKRSRALKPGLNVHQDPIPESKEKVFLDYLPSLLLVSYGEGGAGFKTVEGIHILRRASKGGRNNPPTFLKHDAHSSLSEVFYCRGITTMPTQDMHKKANKAIQEIDIRRSLFKNDAKLDSIFFVFFLLQLYTKEFWLKKRDGLLFSKRRVNRVWSHALRCVWCVDWYKVCSNCFSSWLA